LKLSTLSVVAFAQFTKKSEKTIVTVDIEYQKRFSCSVTSWLSLYRSLSRMFNCTQLQMHTSCPSTSQLLFWNAFLEILWANSVHIKTFAIICGCFCWASSEYW